MATSSEGDVHINTVGLDGKLVYALMEQHWHVISLCCLYHWLSKG